MVKILPFCAKWQRASSTWRRVEAELVLELAINHVSAPSSIRSERPILCPAKVKPFCFIKSKDDLCDFVCYIQKDNRYKPWITPRDSHFAKLASPLATCAMTSLLPDLTIPSSALMPPSSFNTVSSFSVSKQEPLHQNTSISSVPCMISGVHKTLNKKKFHLYDGRQVRNINGSTIHWYLQQRNIDAK